MDCFKGILLLWICAPQLIHEFSEEWADRTGGCRERCLGSAWFIMHGEETDGGRSQKKRWRRRRGGKWLWEEGKRTINVGFMIHLQESDVWHRRRVQANRYKFTSSTFMFLLEYLLNFCPFRPRKSKITEFRWRITKCEQTCTWILVFCVVPLVEGRPDAWSEGRRKAASRDCSSRKREGLYFNQHPAHWSVFAAVCSGCRITWRTGPIQSNVLRQAKSGRSVWEIPAFWIHDKN